VDGEVCELLDSELWRVGGPRPERVVRLFRRAVEAGDPGVVGAFQRAIVPIIRRGWLDADLFEALVPRLEELTTRGRGSLDLARAFREEIVLARLSAAEREALHLSLLRTGEGDAELGLSWQGAACRVLEEHQDGLVPEVEAALSRPSEARESAQVAGYAREVLLPLAHARRSGDWATGYLNLIREDVERQIEVRDTREDSLANRRVREALLELVHEGVREALPVLKELWYALEEPVYEQPETLERHRRFVAMGLADADYPRRGPVALDLTRAIRALGEPAFQTKNVPTWRGLEISERGLVESGRLKPRDGVSQ
jgi:hypothetical protein